MTPTQRLRDLVDDALRPHGFCLIGDPRPVTGYWKSQDVMRWEAFAFRLDRPSHRVSVGSWSTVKDCVRYGVEIEIGHRLAEATIMVYAKEPIRSSEAA